MTVEGATPQLSGKRVISGGLSTLIHYLVPIHRQPAYFGHCHQNQHGLPQTERGASEIRSLRIHPQMKEEQAGQIHEMMLRCCGDAASRE